MQIDYLVMTDNHLMLLVEPFLRYADKSYINKMMEDLVRHACETQMDIEKYLDSYTEQQKMNWKNSKKIVVYENKTQLYRFIENAKERKNAGKKLYFGRIKYDVAQKIKKVTSCDVEGYNCALYSDNIRKIYKDHGNEERESLRGQRAVVDEDFFRIPEIINEPELIESAGLYNKNPVVHFKKNGFTIVGIIADGALDLYTQTMYISKKRSLATAIDERAPINTP